MEFNDREEEELRESDFSGIVADAESSIYNIKRQLLIVQTLRKDLARKEAIISALNGKICDLERDTLLSSQYYHENRVLVERSYQLERAAEASKDEQFLLTKQIITKSQRFDSLKKELESLVKINSEKRTQSDDLQKEFATVKTQLGATEDSLHEIRSKNESLRHDLRRMELDRLKIRNDAKTISNLAEEKSQQNKDKCRILERSLLDSESLVKDQRILVDRWMVRHDGLAVQLVEKNLEIENWKRIFIEKENIVHTLNELNDSKTEENNELRENQIQNNENFKNDLNVFSNKSNDSEKQLKDFDSAIYFLATNIEKFSDVLDSPNSHLNSNLNLKSNLFSSNQCGEKSEMKFLINNLKENFMKNFSMLSSTEFPKLLLTMCQILEDYSIKKEKLIELNDKNDVLSSTSELILNKLQKIEQKYTITKNQIKEAKIVMAHQQSKYNELVNTISILNLDKSRRNLEVENERENHRQIINDQNTLISIKEEIIKENNIEIALNKSNMTDKSNESKTFCTATGYENNDSNNEKNHYYKNNKNDDDSDNYNNNYVDNNNRDKLTRDQDDVNILHETLEFVETLAVHATELESRYEEVLSEKRLLKKMCSGYDELKFELSILASSCSVFESSRNIRENGKSLKSYSSDTEIDSNPNKKSPNYLENDDITAYEYNRLNNNSLSFSRDSLKIQNIHSSPDLLRNSSHRLRLHKNQKKYFRSGPLSIRVVGIYVLASLRLIRILGNVRSERKFLLENPRLLSLKKSRRKLPQQSLSQNSRHVATVSTFPNSIHNKTNNDNSDRSLLELITSADRRPNLEFNTLKGDRNIDENYDENRREKLLFSLIKRMGGADGDSNRFEGTMTRMGREGGVMVDDNILILRETLCNMSEVIAELRAKELLLHLSENRYGVQQRDLWVVLKEAEEALRDKDIYQSVSTPSSALPNMIRERDREALRGSGTGSRSISLGTETGPNIPLFYDQNQAKNRSDIPEIHVRGEASGIERERVMEMVLERERDDIRDREDERERSRMRERERERKRGGTDVVEKKRERIVEMGMEMERQSEREGGGERDNRIYNEREREREKIFRDLDSSTSSTICNDDDDDSLTGDIQKLLYSPSFVAHSPQPIPEAKKKSDSFYYHTIPTPVRTPIKSSLSSSFPSPNHVLTSFSSDNRMSPKEIRKSPGSYTKKIIAGDEKHVSVALRAYALSVVEDEKSNNVIENFHKNSEEYFDFSYPPQSTSKVGEKGGGRNIEREGGRDDITFTEDEIIEMSQTS